MHNGSVPIVSIKACFPSMDIFQTVSQNLKQCVSPGTVNLCTI